MRRLVSILLAALVLVGCGASSATRTVTRTVAAASVPATTTQSLPSATTLTQAIVTTRTAAPVASTTDAQGVVCPAGTVAKGMACYTPSGGDPGVNPVKCPAGSTPDDGGCLESNSAEAEADTTAAQEPSCVVSEVRLGPSNLPADGDDSCTTPSGGVIVKCCGLAD